MEQSSSLGIEYCLLGVTLAFAHNRIDCHLSTSICVLMYTHAPKPVPEASQNP